MLFLQSNDNMELTSSLESERHANRDIGQRLSDTTMELAEFKQVVCFSSIVIFVCGYPRGFRMRPLNIFFRSNKQKKGGGGGGVKRFEKREIGKKGERQFEEGNVQTMFSFKMM